MSISILNNKEWLPDEMASAELYSQILAAADGYDALNLARHTHDISDGEGVTACFKNPVRGGMVEKSGLTDPKLLCVSSGQKCPQIEYEAKGSFFIHSESYQLDQVSRISKCFSMAARNRTDQNLIDAIDVGLTGDTLGHTIALNNQGLTEEKLQRASDLLTEDGFPNRRRHLVMDASTGTRLFKLYINSKETSSFDKQEAWRTGRVGDFMGFKTHVIGNLLEGGLPSTSANGQSRRDVLVWHEDAIGFAHSKLKAIETTSLSKWFDEYLAKMTMRFGMVTYNGLGTIRIQIAR